MFENARARMAAWMLPTNLKEKMAGELFGTMVTQMSGNTAPRRGTAQLLEAYRQSPWLRAVVSKIAQKLAAIPWVVYAQTGRNGK